MKKNLSYPIYKFYKGSSAFQEFRYWTQLIEYFLIFYEEEGYIKSIYM